MTHRQKGWMALLLSIATTSLLVACGGDDSFDDRTGLADPRARFVHAVPGGPAVTLQRNGMPETAATNVDYKFGSQYYDVATQVSQFSLRDATSGNQIATASVDTQRGHKYTLVALPTLTGVELQVIDDPFNKSVTSNDARLRVINAAPNAQTFDVYLTAPNANLATTAPSMSGVAYKQVSPASGADSAEVDGGGYQLRVTPQGSKTVIFNRMVTLPDNGDWLLVVLPDDAAPATPNAIRVLLVRADDTADATDELLNQP